MYVNRRNSVGVCVVLWSIGVASRGLVEVFRRRRQNSTSHARRQNGGRSTHDSERSGPFLIENVLPVGRLKYLWVSPKFSGRCRRDLPVLMDDNEEGGVIHHTRKRYIFMYIVYIGIGIILRHVIWCLYDWKEGFVLWDLNNVVYFLITLAEKLGSAFSDWFMLHKCTWYMNGLWYIKV
jgi:hypothetical protein